MNDIDVSLLLVLEDEWSDEEMRSEENELFKKRNVEGAYEILVRRHLLSNEDKFVEYFRLSPVLFDYLLNFIKDDIISTPYNRNVTPISPEQKLCLLLRFLATGESFRSLAFQFRISHSWISSIVKQVVKSIVKRMLTIALPSPTEQSLKKNATNFLLSWQFPNCVGAIDGKHVRCKAPKNSGSLYFNYKEFYSIVMLALVDANCKFIAVDVGSYGREGDAGIFRKSKLGQLILENEFNIPPSQALSGTQEVVPHVILGDAAFALHENLMKPYPRNQSLHDQSKAVFNYLLSRGRRTSENAFGILSSYFRIFSQPIATSPETTDLLILCACILHNLLRDANILAPSQKFSTDQVPLPNDNLLPISGNNVRPRNNPSEIRETFKTYFSGIGAVDWQMNHARSF